MAETLGIAERIIQLGLTGALMLALYGGYRGWWVFGRYYQEMTKERDEWKALALQGLRLAGKATTLATQNQSTPSEGGD